MSRIIPYEDGIKEGRKQALKKELKFLKSMLQDKAGKKLSKARRQDTGRRTIPDCYDLRLKERIAQIKKEMLNE